MTRSADHLGDAPSPSPRPVLPPASMAATPGGPAWSAWLELSATPSALVTPSMLIVAVNRPMSDLLSARDGLAVVDGCLVALRETDRLRAAVREALHGSPQLLYLDRLRSAGPSSVAAVTPVPCTLAAGDLCLLRVADPARPLSITPQILIGLYALTPTQAEIAIALAEGKTLDTIVAERNIILGTLRRHLHQIFGRTGVGSQGTLIRLILSLDRLLR
jgi:DNA-binding NarL/FixJ family response regulator